MRQEVEEKVVGALSELMEACEELRAEVRGSVPEEERFFDYEKVYEDTEAAKDRGAMLRRHARLAVERVMDREDCGPGEIASVLALLCAGLEEVDPKVRSAVPEELARELRAEMLWRCWCGRVKRFGARCTGHMRGPLSSDV